MHRRTIAIIATIVLIGVALTLLILRTEPTRTAAGEGAAEVGALEYPRGPHGARLLSNGPLQLEVTIYEAGVAPQFRVYPFDATLKPLPPKDVALQIELHRLGGRVDRIDFQPEADYLRGTAVVEEPHSFDVRLTARHAGRSHQFSYSQIEGKVTLGPDQVKSAGISINTVGPREMVTTLDLPGEITADQTRVAQVVPRLQGVITDVLKKEGDRVRKGELMAVLNSRELADAKSAYLAATQQLDFTRVTVEREESLWKKKISAEQDYLEARRAYDRAALSRKLAGQMLVVLGVPSDALSRLASAPAETMARYEIRSPLNGTVTERHVTVGEAVTAEEGIFVVADLSSIWVDITVYAKDLGAVHEGQAATVTSTDLGIEVQGRVSYVGPLVGEQTRAATARIVLPNREGRWRPGLFVNVRLVREATTVPLAVSAEAIQTFRDWQVVFVRYEDAFEARPLELGRNDGQWVEVLKGLSPGEQYAAANSFAVKAEIGKLGATHDH
ncbi:MAG: efflux RND transporter periplasmic adaptor subunit [Vicinamibacteria bacterium]|nr:efflux RND transporter periplasmic adaptor subunit [Vicinamibacteria bacterium]